MFKSILNYFCRKEANPRDGVGKGRWGLPVEENIKNREVFKELSGATGSGEGDSSRGR